MKRFVPDTSCMVAAVASWHERHEHTLAAFEQRFDDREQMVLAAPALIETFSVLTRLPPSHRISAKDALAVLEGSFLGQGRMTALDEADYVALLRRAPAESLAGGRMYDAVIVACAIKAKAAVLLTLNPADFRWVEPLGLRIVVPGEASPA